MKNDRLILRLQKAQQYRELPPWIRLDLTKNTPTTEPPVDLIVTHYEACVGVVSKLPRTISLHEAKRHLQYVGERLVREIAGPVLDLLHDIEIGVMHQDAQAVLEAVDEIKEYFSVELGDLFS